MRDKRDRLPTISKLHDQYRDRLQPRSSRSLIQRIRSLLNQIAELDNNTFNEVMPIRRELIKLRGQLSAKQSESKRVEVARSVNRLELRLKQQLANTAHKEHK